jgi:hypothetical protein
VPGEDVLLVDLEPPNRPHLPDRLRQWCERVEREGSSIVFNVPGDRISRAARSVLPEGRPSRAAWKR